MQEATCKKESALQFIVLFVPLQAYSFLKKLAAKLYCSFCCLLCAYLFFKVGIFFYSMMFIFCFVVRVGFSRHRRSTKTARRALAREGLVKSVRGTWVREAVCSSLVPMVEGISSVENMIAKPLWRKFVGKAMVMDGLKTDYGVVTGFDKKIWTTSSLTNGLCSSWKAR
jgi:hypothetical protein